jgi:DNA-binding helix-hairpin-helix protein with protein kinase domain
MSGFQPRSGLTIYTSDNRPIVLEQQIGRGGEGSVWSIANAPGQAAKLYDKGVAPNQSRKLEAMCRLKSESLFRIAAWPTAMLKTGASGLPLGLLMPRVSGYLAAHLLYTPKSRRTSFPEAQFPFILHASMNIVRAFATVHDAGQVIGDVNHGNLLVSKDAMVALIDCDSFEISDGQSCFPCLVGVPTYTPPSCRAYRPSRASGVRNSTMPSGSQSCSFTCCSWAGIPSPGFSGMGALTKQSKTRFVNSGSLTCRITG